MFIKGEATWQQMAYNRIKSDQESVACSVTYETTNDSTISANATFLADAFSMEAGKFESKACSTTVTYAVIFHDVAVCEESALTRPSSTTDPAKGPPAESEKSELTRASSLTSLTSEKMGPSTRASTPPQEFT